MTLKLVETFVDKCDDPQLLVGTYVPAMMEPLLGDYARSVPDARWAASLPAAEAAFVPPSLPGTAGSARFCTCLPNMYRLMRSAAPAQAFVPSRAPKPPRERPRRG